MSDDTDRSQPAEWARIMAGPFADVMAGPMQQLFEAQVSAAQGVVDAFLGPAHGEERPEADGPSLQELGERMQALWADLLAENPEAGTIPFADPTRFLDLSGRWFEDTPLGDEAMQKKLLDDALAIWAGVLARMVPPDGDAQASPPPELPHRDRRFSDPRWRDQPFYALLHQSYLAMAEQVLTAVEKPSGLPPERERQRKLYTRLLVEALSPAHFPLTNPVVMERIVKTGGQNLLKGMEHLVADMRAGQLTHTDPAAFELGRDIAATPGHVVFETELFQLIQYTPVTDEVLAVPLVIFPPWINRFYILDLGAKKSFVAWALEQGISTFVVSWKSADATMENVGWEDYVAAQEAAIDHVRERLEVPAVHAIGYCVAGTTLAGTLAAMSRRGEAEKVKSATFFTAQVDFTEAGELLAFIDDQQIAAIDTLASDGYVDGRYLAATFNLLRSPDLIWSYVINNYLLGEDYSAFDLLHWNGDTTNLPARFHREYMEWFYRGNRMVVPDALEANGTPIDLSRIEIPLYVQAGREDHIAPAESVWKLTRHATGPIRFMLAGSGHIAGVVNPPAAQKYQYWTIGEPDEGSGPLPETLDDFLAAAKETPGSWWPDWVRWLEAQDDARVPATGKRHPGSKGDDTVEPAPGRYVRMA